MTIIVTDTAMVERNMSPCASLLDCLSSCSARSTFLSFLLPIELINASSFIFSTRLVSFSMWPDRRWKASVRYTSTYDSPSPSMNRIINKTPR